MALNFDSHLIQFVTISVSSQTAHVSRPVLPFSAVKGWLMRRGKMIYYWKRCSLRRSQRHLSVCGMRERQSWMQKDQLFWVFSFQFQSAGMSDP